MREHDGIGGSKFSADLMQGELHLSSRGEAVNAGWGACVEEKVCEVKLTKGEALRPASRR